MKQCSMRSCTSACTGSSRSIIPSARGYFKGKGRQWAWRSTLKRFSKRITAKLEQGSPETLQQADYPPCLCPRPRECRLTFSDDDKLDPGLGTHLSKQLELIFCLVQPQPFLGGFMPYLNQSASVLDVLLLLDLLDQHLHQPISIRYLHSQFRVATCFFSSFDAFPPRPNIPGTLSIV